MKLLTNKQDPRNRIIVVDAYINGDRIVCDANSDDFDLWEDCWTIEDLEDEPINPFDTKLFQDGVKREDERIMKIITDSIFYGAGVEYKDVLEYLDYLEKLKEQKEQPEQDITEFKKALDNFGEAYATLVDRDNNPNQGIRINTYHELVQERINEILYLAKEYVQQEQPQVADASKMEQEVELEKASRNVYESWKGGTMDDFLRDMVELGKALNARKGE